MKNVYLIFQFSDKSSLIAFVTQMLDCASLPKKHSYLEWKTQSIINLAYNSLSYHIDDIMDTHMS